MGDKLTAFEVFDHDRDGCLTQEQAGYVLRSMGYNPSEKQLESMCSSLSDPSRITSSDLTRLTLSAPQPPSTQSATSALMEALRVFDRDENGLIGENELRVILTTLGEGIGIEDVNSVLKEVPVDSNGKIKYADFVKAILKP